MSTGDSTACFGDRTSEIHLGGQRRAHCAPAPDAGTLEKIRRFLIFDFNFFLIRRFLIFDDAL